MNIQYPTFNIQHSAQKGLPKPPVLVSRMFSRKASSIFRGLTQHFRETTYLGGAIKPHQNRCGGATLLIAILMASVMLSVGLGVYQRTYKELYFASFWKQTQIAFAVADSGFECVMYWDLHPAASYTCFSNPSAPWPTIPDGTSQTLSMTVNSTCVDVDIKKQALPPRTIIQSHGYNTCDATNPRRVERSITREFN